MTNDQTPLLSVITVTKNNIKSLTATLESIAVQDFKDYEVIIVYGEPFSETEKVISKFSNSITRIVSIRESQNGIYEAMNQGISASTSKYLWFMNSGDLFSEGKSMTIAIKKMLELNADLLIGNYKVQGENVQKGFAKKLELATAGKISRSVRKTCHQSMVFNRKAILINQKYDTVYKIAADFDMVLKIAKGNNTFWWSEVLSSIEPNGISHNRLARVLLEKQKSRSANFNKLSMEYLIGFFLNTIILAKFFIRKNTDSLKLAFK